MTPANPDALADAPYVLLKRGLFERPGHHGYTGVLRHAGRFSQEEASAYAVHGSSVTMMLASEAPAYSPACWHETQVEDLLDLLRIEREAKATAEARAAQLQAEVEAKDRARDPRVDAHVWKAAASLDAIQAAQPEWLWYEHEHGRVSFGRWPRVAGSAPYVRADIALARAATAREGS